MPYLEESVKEALDSGLIKMSEPGHLTYRLYKCCLDYIAIRGKRFFSVCEVMGALTCCALEFYRRIIAPYEDKKIQENGDVGENNGC